MHNYILGIETTCDETAASVVLDGRIILSNTIASQVEIHKKYGGVVPEVASRYHFERLPSVVNTALETAKISMDKITAIAVATNPGLAPALAVGHAYASGLSLSLGVPLIPVNHLYAHVWANFLSLTDAELNNIPEKFICLLISGGHTQLIECNYSNFRLEMQIVGETVDDAAGEAIDKVARLLGLEYPGGPNLEKLAKSGQNVIELPYPMRNSGDYNFSFSGIKSHIARIVNHENQADEQFRANLANSFQESIFGILVEKTISLAITKGIEDIYIAGGVASNSRIREIMDEKAKFHGLTYHSPIKELCTDNAAMIAGFGINLLR